MKHTQRGQLQNKNSTSLWDSISMDQSLILDTSYQDAWATLGAVIKDNKGTNSIQTSRAQDGGHQELREVGSYGGRKYGALEGYGNQYWPICSSILAWRTPSLTENPGGPQSTETQSLPSWSCGFNLQLVQLVGRFSVFFLSHTAPGFQLWFYFHLFEKEMATHSSILAWRIPWTEESGRYSSWGCKELDMTDRLSLTSLPPLHVCLPLGFALEGDLEDLGLPLWGPRVELLQLLGSQGSGSTRYSGELAARAAGNNSALEGCGNQYWPVRSSILTWRTPLTERPGRP